MNRPEQEAWENNVRATCQHMKQGERDAYWCILDGIRGYCTYWGCPHRTGRY